MAAFGHHWGGVAVFFIFFVKIHIVNCFLLRRGTVYIFSCIGIFNRPELACSTVSHRKEQLVSNGYLSISGVRNAKSGKRT